MRLTFENVKKQIKRGLYLKKGVPNARYDKSYKYTLYYTGSNSIASVCKTLNEVLEESEKIDNVIVE